MRSRVSGLLSHLESVTWQAFLVAGVLLAGVAVYKGVGDFSTMSVPAAVDTLYGGLSLMAPVVGLVGLASRVRADSPRLATIGGILATISILFVIAVWVWFVGVTVALGRFPLIPDESPVWTAAALVLNFLTLSSGFVLLAVASFRSQSIPSTVALLLVVPGLMWTSLIVNVAVGAIPNYDFYVYVVIGASVTAIGYLLRDRGAAVERVGPGTDSAA